MGMLHLHPEDYIKNIYDFTFPEGNSALSARASAHDGIPHRGSWQSASLKLLL